MSDAFERRFLLLFVIVRNNGFPHSGQTLESSTGSPRHSLLCQQSPTISLRGVRVLRVFSSEMFSTRVRQSL